MPALNAPDSEIMQWARDNTRVVFTHDLDFGILLAHSTDSRPSVIQARVQDVSPDAALSSSPHCERTAMPWSKEPA